MAAYGTLVSLMSVIEQIEHHPRPPISLDKALLQSLTEKVTFLEEFLEAGYNSHVAYSRKADSMEMRIAIAASAVEQVIESHIVDQFAESTSQAKKFTCADLYLFLEEVIQGMGSIMAEVMQIKEKMGMEDQMQKNSSISSASIRSSLSGKNSSMVGFDEVFEEVMDKLIGQQSSLQIISIVGMGGIGKTTLARNIYNNPLIVQHFDVFCMDYDFARI